MTNLLWLLGWHASAGTLAACWMSVKHLIGVKHEVVHEPWIEGPMGKIKIKANGWPVGHEAWSE